MAPVASSPIGPLAKCAGPITPVVSLKPRSVRQIQTVEAFASTSSANISEGFFQLWILRGRSLISEATIAKYFGSDVIGTPFGKYSRRIRFAFSLLPRCQGECGRAKYTGSPAAVIRACPAISAPQSQVSDRAICGGRVP